MKPQGPGTSGFSPLESSSVNILTYKSKISARHLPRFKGRFFFPVGAPDLF